MSWCTLWLGEVGEVGGGCASLSFSKLAISPPDDGGAANVVGECRLVALWLRLRVFGGLGEPLTTVSAEVVSEEIDKLTVGAASLLTSPSNLSLLCDNPLLNAEIIVLSTSWESIFCLLRTLFMSARPPAADSSHNSAGNCEGLGGARPRPVKRKSISALEARQSSQVAAAKLWEGPRACISCSTPSQSTLPRKGLDTQMEDCTIQTDIFMYT